MIIEVTDKDADIIYGGLILSLKKLPNNEDLKELKRHLDSQLPEWIKVDST